MKLPRAGQTIWISRKGAAVQKMMLRSRQRIKGIKVDRGLSYVAVQEDGKDIKLNLYRLKRCVRKTSEAKASFWPSSMVFLSSDMLAYGGAKWFTSRRAAFAQQELSRLASRRRMALLVESLRTSVETGPGIAALAEGCPFEQTCYAPDATSKVRVLVRDTAGNEGHLSVTKAVYNKIQEAATKGR